MGTFILGLFTVIVPTFAIPDCVPSEMPVPPRAIKPFEPFVRPQPTPIRPLLSTLCEALLPRCALCASASFCALLSGAVICLALTM